MFFAGSCARHSLQWRGSSKELTFISLVPFDVERFHDVTWFRLFPSGFWTFVCMLNWFLRHSSEEIWLLFLIRLTFLPLGRKHLTLNLIWWNLLHKWTNWGRKNHSRKVFYFSLRTYTGGWDVLLVCELSPQRWYQ